MLGMIAYKLLDAIPTLWLVLTLVFVALRILPGDPALVALGDYATPEQLALFRAQTGLDAPLWQQYFSFLWDVVRLDFGASLISKESVVGLISYNLPYTIALTLGATGLGVILGVPFGVLAAVRKNKLPDSAMRVFSLVGYAIPDFYLGAILLITFALHLQFFPINGGGEGFFDQLHHLILPAVTLAILKIAFLGRLTRTSLLEVLSKDYIRTARAKGAPEKRVIYKHALRNALLPIVTGLGLSLLATLSGSVAVELVFNRPGLGSTLIKAIAERDYPLIQGTIVVFALMVVVVNLLVDMLYSVIDPRIRS
ncbi:ABC transporter permease (plasmid) [Agrobacterium tumefaciens]|jgi:ABC-type dipeptide/oligopeptide/nickel transport system permease component|uniref:ABC transporter permease n=1 Tax=Agrobacterium TaxID=357 RepID=UPI00080FB7CA|nr:MULTISPECIES: ABC transporter permease [Agrobacterium]NSY46404.1 ABC transporter permease [Agrobacterium tumefaciens]NSZ87345.1 ABC transporter permease [Agrobacterium tumefaciens]UZX45349.1 ABC transporter permease [Agrobacterium sp. 13-2099-1-2]WCA72758.1 ABC transporter permease [Agrobacterium tumefaciens]